MLDARLDVALAEPSEVSTWLETFNLLAMGYRYLFIHWKESHAIGNI